MARKFFRSQYDPTVLALDEKTDDFSRNIFLFIFYEKIVVKGVERAFLRENSGLDRANFIS
jgi:hypothetical protein